MPRQSRRCGVKASTQRRFEHGYPSRFLNVATASPSATTAKAPIAAIWPSRVGLDRIEDLLAREQKRGTSPESIGERLRDAVRAFETTHPTLPGAIGQVANALGAMGI